DAAILAVALEGLAAGLPDQALELLTGHAGGSRRSGGVRDRLVDDGPDEIVCAEEERHLCELGPDLYPVGLDMREVVEKRPGHGDDAEVRLARRDRQVRQRRVFRVKGEGNQTGETPRLVLQVPQP